MNRIAFFVAIFLSVVCFAQDARSPTAAIVTYPIVHTGVIQAYDNQGTIPLPKEGEDFYGQDAHFIMNAPAYRDNKDGTITDLVTGLIWQQDMGPKMTSAEAQVKLDQLNKGTYDDWRIPTIKELFSLALYTGRAFGEKTVDPFIDTRYFFQPIGDLAAGEREIDAQTWSATMSHGIIMGRDANSRFGMNFVDGRLKSYPLLSPRVGAENRMYYRFVRGNTEYGRNSFHDNNDGTVYDEATGLMWQKSDAGVALDWKSALEYAESSELAGYSDWRLPSIKELQSIVDYNRGPAATNSPSIDPVFSCTAITNPDGTLNYPYYWSATTLLDGPKPGNQAAYICFGIATAKVNYTIVDAHGAGAVRSDPKSGDASEYPKYFGPQGDMLVVYNYVRLVRTTR